MCYIEASAFPGSVWEAWVLPHSVLQHNRVPGLCKHKINSHIFNRQLASVKVKISVSFSLARLLTGNVIPSVQTLAVQSRCKHSPAEILRMERIILDKVQWDLYTETPMDFLNIVIHAMVMSSWPQLPPRLPQRNPSLHVALLTKQLQHCMACHQLVQFKGSTLVLVIITLELERKLPSFLKLTINLHLFLQVNSTEFIHCKELVDQELMCLEPPNAVYIFYPISQTVQGHAKAGLLCPHPSEWKSSHQGWLRVAVSQPVSAPFTPTTARIPDQTTETEECCDGFRHLHS
uniref:Cyclin I family member 2 n=1 Tax=Cyanoderma ruficeps TaxID=181631 RepID=A0A8C3RFQ5_9PASS